MFCHTDSTRPPETKSLNGSERPITIDGLNRAQDRAYVALGVRQPSLQQESRAVMVEANCGERLVVCPECGEKTMIIRPAEGAPLQYSHHDFEDGVCANAGKPYP